MHDPCDKPFLLVPWGDLDLWPTSRSNLLPGGGPQFFEFACYSETTFLTPKYKIIIITCSDNVFTIILWHFIKIATKLQKLQLFSSIYPNEKLIKFQKLWLLQNVLSYPTASNLRLLQQETKNEECFNTFSISSHHIRVLSINKSYSFSSLQNFGKNVKKFWGVYIYYTSISQVIDIAVHISFIVIFLCNGCCSCHWVSRHPSC